MEDCRTPTIKVSSEFIFKVTPTLLRDASSPYNQDVHGAIANMRTYTPIYTNVKSPGISPIYKLAGTISSPLTSHHSSSFSDFKKPTSNISSKVNFLSPRPKYDSGIPESSPVILTGQKQSPQNVLQQSPLNSSILNKKLTMRLLLKSVGLEHYSKKLDVAGINCNNVHSVKTRDLKAIGIQSDDDCKKMLDVFESLRTA